MLVSARDMLIKARDGHYAVGQFNITLKAQFSTPLST